MSKKKYSHGKLESTDALVGLFDLFVMWVACRFFKHGCEDSEDDE
jgi:hypothetical protein